MSRTEDIARVLADPRMTPERVEAYLRANGWTKHRGIVFHWDRPDVGAVWKHPERPTAHVPYDRELADYDLRMWETVNICVDAFDLWPMEVAAAILATPLPTDPSGEGQS